jgi:hypothetical protein
LFVAAEELLQCGADHFEDLDRRVDSEARTADSSDSYESSGHEIDGTAIIGSVSETGKDDSASCYSSAEGWLFQELRDVFHAVLPLCGVALG